MNNVEPLQTGLEVLAIPFEDSDFCPTCEQPIPLDRLAAVKGRYAARERELTTSIAAQFDRLRADDQAKMARVLEQTKQEAANAVAKAQVDAKANEERTRADLEKSFQQRWDTQLAVIQQTHAAALQERDAAIAVKLADFTRDREESEHNLKVQLTKALSDHAGLAEAARAAAAQVDRVRIEAQQAQDCLRAQMDEQMVQRLAAQAESLATTHRAEVDVLSVKLADAALDKQAAMDAANFASQQREAAAEANLTDALTRLTETEATKAAIEEQLRNANAAKAAEIAQVREVMEADKNCALLAEQSKRFNETQKLSADLDDLRRKFEKKSADELGEGAELVLFEELKRAFRGDLISEVKRGQPGADIIHEIRLNGITVGKLIYDSKNRKDWKTEYATKLRSDQIAEHADHAVLSTNKFPAGTKQLHIYDHVIIACPARVLALATLLREQIITIHTLRVSNEERDEKTAKLYDFICSPRFTQLLEAVNTQLAKLERIDTDERKTHDAVWTKRGKTFKAIEKANGDLRFEVNRIVGVLPAAASDDKETDE